MGAIQLARPLSSMITRLERRHFNPASASCEVTLHRMNKTIASIYEKAKNKSYDLTQVYLLDGYINRQIERFWAWSHRRIITVSEACKIFNRSRSTIYRWIKQGRLPHAIKEKGRWQIAL